MSRHRLPPPILVDNASALDKMARTLRDVRLFALDTESDSLFSYYPKVCLIQISVYANNDQTEIADYLVDPLQIQELKPLGELLSHLETEVVMHAADNDLLLLQREFGIVIHRLFDTQLAARILGRRRVGLAAMLEEQFGVNSNKRMQRTNWGKRPLQADQIVYAQKDTHYLLPLREILIAELKATDRWEEAQEGFELLADTDYADKTVNKRTMWQMKETRSVPRECTGVLAALWEWREEAAKRRNTPPFKILRNQALVELAMQQPATARELASTPGVGKTTVQRYGAEILRTIQEGRRRPLPALPEPTVRPEYLLDKRVQARYDALRRWRTRTAQNRNVAPEIVLTNGTLLEIAKRRPTTLAELQEIREIGPWKAKTYGPAILEIVAR